MGQSTGRQTPDRRFTLIIYIQLYSPECTLAENININNNKQNKDRNILINTVQLNIRYTFVNVLTKDITEDALCKFPHEFRTPRNAAPAVPIDRQPVGSKPAACRCRSRPMGQTDGRTLHRRLLHDMRQ